jgi:outer membrane biosynthesis protein TonB
MRLAPLLALLLLLGAPASAAQVGLARLASYDAEPGQALVPAADVEELVGQFKRWLWPPPAPLPPPPPPPAPPLPPPKTEPPPPRVEIPVEVPRVAPRPAAKPKPRRRPRPAAVDEGPDLPWPCWLVRLHAFGKSEAELEAMRIANGVAPLTPKQRRQAQACLAGLPRVPDRKGG